MTNEIKEILDSIKYAVDEDDWFEIEGHFLKPLLNYITNLQEELKYQKEREIEYNEKHTKLMNRCKKIREYLEEPNRDNFDFSKVYILNILEGSDKE